MKQANLQLCSNNFNLKQLSTIVKTFNNKALEYKANFNLKIIYMRYYIFLSDESLFMWLPFDVTVYL